MIVVEDARKAVQLIQYSIRGLAEILVSGEKVDEDLIVDAAYCVLSASTLLDLYLTHSVSERAQRLKMGLDTHGVLLFLSSMTPFVFPLSTPDCMLTISWPKDGAEIFHLEGGDGDVRSRWESLFSIET